MEVSFDPSAAANFIVERLCRQLSFSHRTCRAAAETEQPFGGDDWFWTDDNAKIIELLTRPEFASRYAAETDEIFRFVRLMCQGQLILRRVSTPRLLLTSTNQEEDSYYHSLMHMRCRLRRGMVLLGIRFHDGRTADNLLMSANRVDFTHRGRRHTLVVEPAIDQTGSELKGTRLELMFAGDLALKIGWKQLKIGRITYRYVLDSRSLLFTVEVALDVDATAEISDVVLTIGHDHLSHGVNDVNYGSLLAKKPDGNFRFAATEPGRHKLAMQGAEYYALVQSQIAGFALAAHSAPREPELLEEIELLVREPGRLHFAAARYRFAGPCRGRRLVASEDKMLTAGGFYDRIDDYSGLLRDAILLRSSQETAIDYSVSYDYGAELNAFAQYYVRLSTCDGTRENATEVKALFDFYLDVYFEMFVDAHMRGQNAIFSRQLAFVMLGLATMYQATRTEAYRERLTQLCDVLLQFEKQFTDVAGDMVSGFMMGVATQRIVFVDCHSAAMLALAEAARHIDDPRIIAAIDRGLGCFCLETARIEWHDGPRKVDLVSVEWVDDDDKRHRNQGFWNFHAGLMLRLFAALRVSPVAGLRSVAARHGARIALLEALMRRQLRLSSACDAGLLEIRSSVLSTETNSETQPWAALGLMDRAASLAGTLTPASAAGIR